MSGIAIMFQIRRDRLPDATRFENIAELRAQVERVLAERKLELSVVEQKIQQRDRLVAEVAGLEEQRTTVKAELASLDSARHEIDEVKSEAAEVAAQLAKVANELASKTDEYERISEKLNPGRLADLQQQLERLSNERSELESTLPSLRAERENALQRIEEGNGIHARIAARQLELGQLERATATLTANIEELERHKADLTELEARVSHLRNEELRLEGEVARRDGLVAEIRSLESERERAASAVVAMDEQLEILANLKAELAQARSRHNELGDEVERLLRRKERLEQETAGQSDVSGDTKQLLEDLTKIPPSLQFPAVLRKAPRTESEALHAVSDYLHDHGLDYSRRTVRAFHTALKINDSAQLTVLAGVSGTGKSLLPRRYAEAMGIHFLQIAVEPRWDSPQDLLGFYNYIEKNYRATDLARILVHMDPYSTLGTADHLDRKDHMTLVLLDEMNLARVEYYFSEFLSRLEARPRFSDAVMERKRADAMIPIDIRGMKLPVSLFPSHNVLFAGTMNDDESTQALSDKVLDRSNILQFAAPQFETDGRGSLPIKTNGIDLSNEAQSFKSWRTWVRPASNLSGAHLVDTVISKLAGLMEACGRPFGHRLRDAIVSYVANYPTATSGSIDFRVPLADQIELRIMPKLRGLEIDGHRAAFNELDNLLRDDLNDAAMADRLAELCERQRNGAGLFVWRGLTREV
jgi:hypothetical protein